MREEGWGGCVCVGVWREGEKVDERGGKERRGKESRGKWLGLGLG